MYNTLNKIVTDKESSPNIEDCFSDKEYAQTSLVNVDKLQNTVYCTIQTAFHEPSIAVHDVFTESIPNAFGLDFLHQLIGKSNKNI